MSKYRFFGSRILKIALVLDYDLSEAIYWPQVSKYRFFGSVISKIALVLDYNIPEAIFWPPKDL